MKDRFCEKLFLGLGLFSLEDIDIVFFKGGEF